MWKKIVFKMLSIFIKNFLNLKNDYFNYLLIN